jgi:hypothetical protein
VCTTDVILARQRTQIQKWDNEQVGTKPLSQYCGARKISGRRLSTMTVSEKEDNIK